MAVLLLWSPNLSWSRRLSKRSHVFIGSSSIRWLLQYEMIWMDTEVSFLLPGMIKSIGRGVKFSLAILLLWSPRAKRALDPIISWSRGLLKPLQVFIGSSSIQWLLQYDWTQWEVPYWQFSCCGGPFSVVTCFLDSVWHLARHIAAHALLINIICLKIIRLKFFTVFK